VSDKKILIITYYWPPSGGSGVQRWLKFVKYLPQFGWKPYVLTPENPSFDIRDESLLKNIPTEAEVIKLPIWEPYGIFNSITSVFLGRKKTKAAIDQTLSSSNERSFFQRVIAWIRASLFIPDPRIFWVRPSVKFLQKFLEENKITTIVTTGPPHSIHLIGLRLKKKNSSLQWISDFRDPWTEWGLWEKLQVGKWAMNQHRKLEKEVLTTADVVISVTPFYVKRFEALSGRSAVLLTNGFDEEDFKSVQYSRPKKFTIRHIGIVNEQRDPVSFMVAFEKLIKENPEFRENVIVEFVGEVYQPFKDYVKSIPSILPYVNFVGNVSHSSVLEYYGSTSVLLLILTGYRDPHGFFPGKLFEYIATGAPVLGIGPAVSEAADVLKDTQAGIMVENDDVKGIIEFLQKNFEMWKSSAARNANVGLSKYSRKEITAELVKLLR
jgi:glycosyltransferase involved in cell wall biosynthesis